MHALVVEDNRDLARLFSDLLAVLGCTSDIAWSARAGLEKAYALVPDLVFCDLSMPGDLDGFDVARELRKNPAFAHTWLVAVTGFDSADMYVRAMDAGFTRIFAKPVKFAQIQTVLANLREARQATTGADTAR